MNRKFAAGILLSLSFSPKISALVALEKTYSASLEKSDFTYSQVFKNAEDAFRRTGNREAFISSYKNAQQASALSKKAPRELFQKGKKRILDGSLEKIEKATSTPASS